jgi:hypothetical protein
VLIFALNYNLLLLLFWKIEIKPESIWNDVASQNFYQAAIRLMYATIISRCRDPRGSSLQSSIHSPIVWPHVSRRNQATAMQNIKSSLFLLEVTVSILDYAIVSIIFL